MSSYQQEDFVESAVESVLAQSFVDWELVVVDDGSRDGSHERVLNIARRDIRIRAFCKVNGGHCSALNFGLKHIAPESDYLFFLDGDDLIKPRYLELMATYLDEHVEVGLVCCQAARVDSSGKFVGKFHRSRWLPGICGLPRKMRLAEYSTPFVVFYCASGQGMSGLYRRSVFERTDGWDIRFSRHEDTDIFCQMALLAEVHYLPDVLYGYRVHERNVTRMCDLTASKNFETFRVGGYEAFREKWDNQRPRNTKERELLDSARRYYYGVHRPLRFVRIAFLSMGDFVRTGQLAALLWAAKCMHESLASVVRYWIFPKIH